MYQVKKPSYAQHCSLCLAIATTTSPATPTTMHPASSCQLHTSRLHRGMSIVPLQARDHTVTTSSVHMQAVEGAKKEKVREPVPDEQLANLKQTLSRAHAAQREYSTFTQEQVREGGEGERARACCVWHLAWCACALLNSGCAAHLCLLNLGMRVCMCMRVCPPLPTHPPASLQRLPICVLTPDWLPLPSSLTTQVDKIFKECALAANAARIPLAKMAVEETRMGVVEDKVGFNCLHICSFTHFMHYTCALCMFVSGGDLHGHKETCADSPHPLPLCVHPSSSPSHDHAHMP